MRRSRTRTAGMVAGGLLGAALWLAPAHASVEVGYDCGAAENRDKHTTVEIVLAQRWKPEADQVKRALTGDSAAVKVRVRFYPFLDPPTNIGIGSCVSAEVGRRAIQEAVHTNGQIDRLIRQDILPHHWVKIGSTDTAELAWTPISPEDLAALTDPALSTEQFQTMYRQLAAPKERRLPFGMGTQPVQPTDAP